jgi:phosphatidylserine/phosphatidylglycerophosphate/cardiolipin synthase-like enzyme
MSKSTSRFIANNELWNEIHDRVAKGKHVSAAVAYIGRDGARLLPLKKGDCIVVGMSLGAVRQGATDPRAVRTLMSRGVRVFSRATLHAKFIVADGTLIASSANASHNSRDILDEAGIINC